MIQKASYGNGGGYALHKMTGYWSGKCSGYYGADGTLRDAEQICGRWVRVVRPVKRGGRLWKELQRVGMAYRDVDGVTMHRCGEMVKAAVAVGAHKD